MFSHYFIITIFVDHEACFVLYGNPGTGQQPPPLTLRVRRALDDTSAPWHLRYVII